MSSADRRPSALPSPRARALAFTAVLVAGVCGSLIGWSLVRLQCSGECALAESAGLLSGGIVFAAGVSIVAVLALRAMNEWRATLERDDGTSDA